MYSELFRKIEQSNKIAIFMHNRPDGDAFASAISLDEFIKINYHNKIVCLYAMDYTEEPVFEKMLNGKKVNGEETGFDLAIAVDCANLERFSLYENVFSSAKFTINIDHHQDNSNYADINFVKNLSSCSEFLFNILLSSGLKINKRIATLTIAGMITDTNYFSVPTVTKDSFLTVAKIQEMGVDVVKIRNLFYSGNENNIFKLLGTAMAKAEFYYDGKLMFIDLNQEDFDKCLVPEDTGCLINQIFASSQAVSCFLLTPRNNMNHISMRSVQGVNVNSTAQKLGGGGHICASATNTNLPINEIRDFILEDMREDMERYNKKDENLFV